MFYLGLDVGSASSKVVIINENDEILASCVVQAGTGSSGPSRALDEALHKLELKPEDINTTVATGYGRYAYDKADKQISEITCHAKGIFHLVPTTRTIIDIGGQDAKAIGLDERGSVSQFFMNDKCAAGTGRFLDVMARVLEIDISEMEVYDSKASEVTSVSSTCTVFAESEVISHLSNNVPKENIIAGIHASVASKACSLAYRTGIKEDIVMAGGVARNSGVVRAISRELGKPVLVAPNPQITGALGAALFAKELNSKN